MVDNFWNRVKQSQGPRLDFGSFLYDDWGDVPGRTENPYPQSSGPWTGMGGGPYYPSTPIGDWAKEEQTTSVPKGPGVGVGALGPIVTGQARTGLGQSGQEQVAGQTMTLFTPAGQLPGGGGATTWTQQPEWMDGGYNLGWDFKNGTYTPRNQTYDKGYVVGSDVGWQSGMALPVGYNAAQDTYRGGLGGTETAIHKAIRMANDLVKNGQAKSPQRALEYAMGFVQAEARRAGQSTGWEMSTLADQLGGYDEKKSYFSAETPPPPSAGAPPPGQEGTPVVSPLNSQGQPGQASGAPPTAPGAQMGQPAGQTATDYNLYLQNNKVGRMAELLTRLGLGTPQRQRSFVGSTLANTYTDLFDPWMQTQGIGGGNVADNFSNLMDNFVGKMQGSGGMGAIAGDANAAIKAISQGGSPYAQGLGDTELFGLLKGFNQLANTPMNPWMQQAYGNLSDDALFSFAQQQGNRLKNGGVDDGTAQTLLQFLQADPRFGFLTGQGR